MSRTAPDISTEADAFIDSLPDPGVRTQASQTATQTEAQQFIDAPEQTPHTVLVEDQGLLPYMATEWQRYDPDVDEVYSSARAITTADNLRSHYRRLRSRIVGNSVARRVFEAEEWQNVVGRASDSLFERPGGTEGEEQFDSLPLNATLNSAYLHRLFSKIEALPGVDIDEAVFMREYLPNLERELHRAAEHYETLFDIAGLPVESTARFLRPFNLRFSPVVAAAYARLLAGELAGSLDGQAEQQADAVKPVGEQQTAVGGLRRFSKGKRGANLGATDRRNDTFKPEPIKKAERVLGLQAARLKQTELFYKSLEELVGDSIAEAKEAAANPIDEVLSLLKVLQLNTDAVTVRSGIADANRQGPLEIIVEESQGDPNGAVSRIMTECVDKAMELPPTGISPDKGSIVHEAVVEGSTEAVEQIAKDSKPGGFFGLIERADYAALVEMYPVESGIRGQDTRQFQLRVSRLSAQELTEIRRDWKLIAAIHNLLPYRQDDRKAAGQLRDEADVIGSHYTKRYIDRLVNQHNRSHA